MAANRLRISRALRALHESLDPEGAARFLRRDERAAAILKLLGDDDANDEGPAFDDPAPARSARTRTGSPRRQSRRAADFGAFGPRPARREARGLAFPEPRGGDNGAPRAPSGRVRAGERNVDKLFRLLFGDSGSADD